MTALVSHPTFTRYMVPKRRTFNSTPLPPTSITMSNTTNNNMNITDTPGIGDAAFGGYKLVAVGTSEHTIQVPVALPMSKHPYRKVMVVNLFFRKIKTLATDLSFTSAKLVSTIATYFNWNTSPVEKKSSIAAETIPAAVLHVSNLTGLSYQNQYGAAVSFDITDARPANLRYFTFRSNWRASDIDSRWPNDLFSVDFVLKWPQNTVTASTPLLFNITSPTIDTNTNMTVNTDPLVALLFELGNLGDDHVVNLSTDDMRALLKRSVSAIIDTPTESVKRKTRLEKNLFGSPTTPSAPSLASAGAPKMDSVFASASTRLRATYTGPLDFLEDYNQSVFTTIFGENPTPLILTVTTRNNTFCFFV